jgi:hypothetical protein
LHGIIVRRYSHAPVLFCLGWTQINRLATKTILNVHFRNLCARFVVATLLFCTILFLCGGCRISFVVIHRSFMKHPRKGNLEDRLRTFHPYGCVPSLLHLFAWPVTCQSCASPTGIQGMWSNGASKTALFILHNCVSAWPAFDL